MTSSSPGGRRGFLLMPFCNDLDWLKDVIVNAGIDANVIVHRADDISAPGVIIDQVFEAISQADVVIAVCTDRNANVFFELGYAWRNHDAVLVASSEVDLPFDVSHLRTEFYGKPDSGLGPSTIRRRLAQAIKSVADDKESSEQESKARPQADIDKCLQWLEEIVKIQMDKSPLPVIYLAIVPLTEYDRLFYPDGPTTRDIADLSTPPVFGMSEVGEVIFRYVRPKFKGVTLDESEVRTFGYDWIEFYNDGAFLGIITGHDSLQHGVLQFERQSRAPVNDTGFYDNMLTCQVVARLRAFGLLASHFSLSTEVTIRIGIASVALPATVATGRHRTGVRNTGAVRSPLHSDLNVTVLDELTTISGVLRTAVTLLNDLMPAFPMARCFQLEADGTVVLSTWGFSVERGCQPLGSR